MPDYRDALAAAVTAAREAGAILREGIGRPDPDEFAARADALIRDRLPALPSHQWLVAPNDGAAHYARGQRGSAIAIAAERDGKPILGLVFAFAYPDHDGDLIAWAEGCGPIRRDGRACDDVLVEVPLFAEAVTFDSRLVVYVAPEADEHPHAIGQRLAPARFVPLPSLAYRLALVAVGDGIAALSWPGEELPAAGVALLKAAGGVIGKAGSVIAAGAPLTVRSLCDRTWDSPPAPAPTEPGPALVRPSRYPPARLSGRVVSDPGVLARAQGCLLGQAAGDALGGLVEFDDTDSIKRRYPHGCRELHDGGTWNNLAGQPTDDTELALLLARSLVHAGRYDRGEVLLAYVDWWNDPRTYDRGSTIGKALSAAARGTTAEERLALIERHANRSSQANGSLMRISPVGVFCAGRPDLAAEIALHESRLTHPHPVCGQCCAVYAAAIATAIATGCGPLGAYEEALRQAARLEVDPSVRDVLERARTEPPVDYYTNQGWVLIALQNAFHQLLKALDLESGLVATVESGGDTDTTGAIAGALLGAVHGRKAIPARWRRTLLACRTHAGTPTDHKRAREYWPCDVMELAELLLLAGDPHRDESL